MRGTTNRSTSRRLRAALSAAVAVCAVTAVLPAAASAADAAPAPAARGLTTSVERISIAPDGTTQADGNSGGASITPNGRHVVFSSSARNLSSDTPPAGDNPYLRDQQTGQTKRVASLAPLQPPAVSGNGEYVAYATQWMRNVRIRMEQVNTGRTASANCSAYSCNQPSLSSDGRYLSLAILYTQPGLERQRIEVQDSKTGTTQTVASLPHTLASRPSMSGDARYVAYQDADRQDVYLRDLPGNTLVGPIEGPSATASLVQLSDDGSKIVYLSGTDTYVYDVASATAQPVPNVRGVAIDPTGRYLLYAPNGTNGTTGPSLTLRDLQTGTDEVVATQPASAGTGAVSAGGHDVVFQSTADDIVPGDTNGKSDVFVRHFS
ncbi:hypothetical protein OHS33_34570 [Streptomyces sp. NBC_00536]|uniref:hypothetical protein n=1 Tax=Streptomyces sp. NBC_00536 TaxID=2975769 RepID=UPI002E823651|nr:hypothetical protein [Streptomyces sp. NBC_00536]WUC83044.1 hypothetical protein OHS33_34570 [Streptomyces sp. NBC_00536]